MEEVAPMKLNTILMRPSLPLTAACMPSVSLPATAAPMALMAAERTQAPQVHQVQVQSELGKTALVLIGGKLVDGNNSTTGFKGSNDSASRPRYTDGGSGVPPRGRPV
jgi:hypothetical protein